MTKSEVTSAPAEREDAIVELGVASIETLGAAGQTEEASNQRQVFGLSDEA